MSETTTVTMSNTKTGNLDDRDYAAFRHRVADRLESNIKEHGALFTTDAELWPLYLASFREGPERQHHDCSACRHFIRRYGGLAVITSGGLIVPALWKLDDADRAHAHAVRDMARAVSVAKITGVFIASKDVLGTPLTGEWAHLALRIPKYLVHDSKLKTAGQAMAERRQDFGNVMRALAEFSVPMLDRVVELLETDVLDSADRVIAPAKWLRDVAREYASNRGHRANVVWRAVATAPAGFCHPRSTVVGTFLSDLAGGMDFDSAARRFRDMMHPLKYQRPQAPPKAQSIDRAEEIVEKLGIARSLERRFARLEDVQEKLWVPSPLDAAPAKLGVFGHLRPIGTPPGVPNPELPAHRVTWAKFRRDALSAAAKIEALAPAGRGPFCGLLTAVHADAPPILQWDSSQRRNPVSWYVYNGGSDSARWNLRPSQWVDVTAICRLPSEWGDLPSQWGRSAIFILDGCRDTHATASSLFPECLRGELREVRSVIEAHSNRTPPSGADEASACGLRIQDDARGGEISVRVTSRSGLVTQYMIDRWE